MFANIDVFEVFGEKHRCLEKKLFFITVLFYLNVDLFRFCLSTTEDESRVRRSDISCPALLKTRSDSHEEAKCFFGGHLK